MGRVLRDTLYYLEIKKKVKVKTFEKLQKLKQSHSKVMNIEHTEIKMQNYLQPTKAKVSIEKWLN